jgi:transposase
MARFRTPGHLASWAGRTPLDRQSGSKAGRARHKHGNRCTGAVTGETAIAAGKTQTREGARYGRLARRRGKAKAQVALGNTQMRELHVLLSNPGMRYKDLGYDYHEQQRATARQVSHHVGKLGALGYDVTLSKRPDPDPDEDAQAA